MRLTPRSGHENAKSPMRLLLSQIEQQTRDTKTLRFQILDERLLRAKPRQFLTFQWTIDGRRVTRSYTISSSPVYENHVEITPLCMERGDSISDQAGDCTGTDPHRSKARDSCRGRTHRRCLRNRYQVSRSARGLRIIFMQWEPCPRSRYGDRGKDRYPQPPGKDGAALQNIFATTNSMHRLR